MGILRGGLLGIFTFLFFLAIIVQGFFLTFYFSLDYSVVSSQIHPVLLESIEKEGLSLQILGENQEIIEKNISDVIEKNYYQSYDCGFIDCIEKTGNPFSLLSKNARTYWKNNSLLLLLVLLVFAEIVYLLIENRSNFFLLSFILFGLASLFFFELNFISNFVLNSFFGSSSLLILFSIFFFKSYFVFYLFLGITILFLSIYLIIQFFEAKFEIYCFFKRISEWFGQDPIQKQVPKRKL